MAVAAMANRINIQPGSADRFRTALKAPAISAGSAITWQNAHIVIHSTTPLGKDCHTFVKWRTPSARACSSRKKSAAISVATRASARHNPEILVRKAQARPESAPVNIPTHDTRPADTHPCPAPAKIKPESAADNPQYTPTAATIPPCLITGSRTPPQNPP